MPVRKLHDGLIGHVVVIGSGLQSGWDMRDEVAIPVTSQGRLVGGALTVTGGVDSCLDGKLRAPNGAVIDLGAPVCLSEERDQTQRIVFSRQTENRHRPASGNSRGQMGVRSHDTLCSRDTTFALTPVELRLMLEKRVD